jgi:protein-L-isoaspartate(D-aspartate) O-methyltransferase
MRRALSVALLLLGACSQKSASVHAGPADAGLYEQKRLQMVERQIESRGVRDPHVLRAMRTVPRHRFVPESQRASAYEDRPLPIGHQQTISQPYIVALMSELADLKPGDRVLEVGTGSGYQAAVLAEMGVEVFSIEIVEPLAKQAAATLKELGYAVTVRHGDGYAGWPEQAPFDAILVTAAPPHIPEPLEAQLALGGRLVIPVGQHFQSLVRVTRTEKGLRKQKVLPVRFVPMTGEVQER